MGPLAGSDRAREGVRDGAELEQGEDAPDTANAFLRKQQQDAADVEGAPGRRAQPATDALSRWTRHEIT